MAYSKDKFLKKLYVITPFKDKNLDLIRQTIFKLSENKTNITLQHYIIYDKSCKKLVQKLINEIKFLSNKNLYFNNFIEANSNGIYTAINQALDIIPLNSYYLVLGAGDLLLKIKGSIKISGGKIILFPYVLSTSIKKQKIINIRNIFSGMPYCHNAISYINDGSKYSLNYKISADYDHFLNYISRNNLNKKKLINSVQENIIIEFESKYGISSRFLIIKNLENIMIIYRYFGILKIFTYFWHTLKRIINIFWKVI